MKGNQMGQLEIERLGMEKEISDFLSQSFLELDEGERQLMKHFGLTLTQYWALVHLKDEEGHSLSELADLLICDKSNVTSLVDRLEKSGLAERKAGKNGDRRYIRVVLTPQGHHLRKIVMSAREHLLKLRFQTLDTESLQQLRAPLQLLAGTLQTQFKSNEVSAMIENIIERMSAEQEVSPILS
jgi:DNA-binding MarR family transcriptional regulator